MTQKFKNVFHTLVFDVCIMELLQIKKPSSNVWNEGENTYYVYLKVHGKGFDVLFSSYFHLYHISYCENINFIDVKRLFKSFVVKLRLILRILPCHNKCLLSCKFLKKSSSIVPLPLQVSNIISFELFLILICTSCVDYPQNGIGYLGKKKCCQIWCWIEKTVMHVITSSASKSFF